jgi:hypothetical protein
VSPLGLPRSKNYWNRHYELTLPVLLIGGIELQNASRLAAKRIARKDLRYVCTDLRFKMVTDNILVCRSLLKLSKLKKQHKQR